jgi:membrane protein
MRKLSSLPWADLGLSLYSQMQAAQIPLVASSLAYTTVLSLIPLLAVSFAVFNAFVGMEKLSSTVTPWVLSTLAEGTGQQVVEFIESSIRNTHAGTIGLTGFVALLFTSMSMLSSAENAIHQVWKEPIKRTWFQRIANYWLFLSLSPLILALAIGAGSNSALPMLRWLPGPIVSFALGVLFFFAVYKGVPDRKVHWLPALLSALLATILWTAAKSGYAVYAKMVITYKTLYGGLAAFPLFLIWIYLIWLIVLSCAALTAVLQKRLELK